MGTGALPEAILDLTAGDTRPTTHSTRQKVLSREKSAAAAAAFTPVRCVFHIRPTNE